MNHKIGAHLSIAGGFQNPLNKITQIGGNCLQIFSSNPFMWIDPDLNNETVQQFKNLRNTLKIDPIYFHASYLLNLADNAQIGELSKKTLIEELRVAQQLGIKGSVIHLGSFKDNITPPSSLRSRETREKQSQSRLPPFGILRASVTGTPRNDNTNDRYKILLTNIQEILTNTPPETFFIIENAGNKKIGQSIDEIAHIIKMAESIMPEASSRIKVCLDTCHLFAAGYEFATQLQLDSFLEMFDKSIGLDRLELIHLNDSRDPFESGRDRHENIGEGTLGLTTFGLLLNHPSLKDKPFILETPGFDKKGPDEKNISIVTSLIT